MSIHPKSTLEFMNLQVSPYPKSTREVLNLWVLILLAQKKFWSCRWVLGRGSCLETAQLDRSITIWRHTARPEQRAGADCGKTQVRFRSYTARRHHCSLHVATNAGLVAPSAQVPHRLLFSSSIKTMLIPLHAEHCSRISDNTAGVQICCQSISGCLQVSYCFTTKYQRLSILS